jgi:NAD+ synthase
LVDSGVETTTRHSDDLSLDAGLVTRLLEAFLRDEIRNAGFERAVLGLSGGVDSAVAAFLAARALGAGNVLGVMMPYRTSSPASLEDAREVVEKTGIRSELVEITPLVDAYRPAGGELGNIRAGNVMARQRMIVLYDLSARDRALVVGTSNKTELLLGYGTLHGDMASAVNPLGDLYKTQVLRLAAALGVPKRILEKPPSADLWEGQTDEGEMGMTYAAADQLLYQMVDERRTDAELEALGFDRAMIRAVRTRIRTSQFKRRPPVIAKVSHRTVNIDFRYPRDWGT